MYEYEQEIRQISATIILRKNKQRITSYVFNYCLWKSGIEVKGIVKQHQNNLNTNHLNILISLCTQALIIFTVWDANP